MNYYFLSEPFHQYIDKDKKHIYKRWWCKVDEITFGKGISIVGHTVETDAHHYEHHKKLPKLYTGGEMKMENGRRV